MVAERHEDSVATFELVDERSTHLGQIQRGTITTVVIVSIHMEDFLSFYRQQAGEDTFGEASSQDDHLRSILALDFLAS
jgi:hypothetical protein